MRGVVLAAVMLISAGFGALPADAKDIVAPRRGLAVGTNKPDRIAAEGGGGNTIRCRAGRDIVTADPADKVAADCEVVSLRVSRDPYRNASSQHQTQVEPDSFAYGSTVVTTFQSGRFFDGGASNNAWATSTDGGRTWRSGFLPGTSQFSSPPGLYPRVSDPVVAYDAAHGVWLISSLGFSEDANAMLISRSTDGVRWDLPVTAMLSTINLALDKEWIVCDNWASSPFRGNCYLTYADFGVNRLVTQTSSDGGLTWSAAVPSPAFGDDSLNGAQPVVRPDGTLVILFSGRSVLAHSTSTDGGATFTPATTIVPQSFLDVPRIRSSPFPSVEVDAMGTIYAAWNDCGLRATCSGDDVVLTSSADGRTWSPPRRVPTGRAQARRSYFTPGLGANPERSGRIGIVYYELQPCLCRIDAGFISSADGGATWGRAQRLTARPVRPSWIARTTLGLMLGDYISTSWVGSKPIPVFSLAAPPVNRRLQQATFVTVRGIG